jgi:hypothetical protein
VRGNNRTDSRIELTRVRRHHMRENRKTRRGKIAGRRARGRRRPPAPADGFRGPDATSRGGVRRGCRACRDELLGVGTDEKRGGASSAVRGRERTLPGRSPRCSLGSRRRASATLSGWNAAGRRVDRRSPRCVGTVASRGRFRALPRGRPRFHRALERRARTPSVAEFFPRFVLASYLGRSHSTEVHGGSCSVFSAGKRDGSRSSRRAVRSARESQTNVVCADVVNSACTEVRRAGGSARKSRDGASTPRTDLERDVLDRAFAQFPEPSIFLSVSFQPRMAVCMSF